MLLLGNASLYSSISHSEHLALAQWLTLRSSEGSGCLASLTSAREGIGTATQEEDSKVTCSTGTYQAGPPPNSGLTPHSPGWKETSLDAPNLASLKLSQPFLGTLK